MASPDFMTLLTTAGTAAVGQAVGPIEIRTNLNADDPIIIDPFSPQDPNASQEPSWIMTLLKPEVRVQLPNGEFVWSPSGRPGASYAPLVAAAIGGILFTLVGVGGFLGKFAKPTTLLLTGAGGLAALALLASQAKLESQGAQ